MYTMLLKDDSGVHRDVEGWFGCTPRCWKMILVYTTLVKDGSGVHHLGEGWFGCTLRW